MSKKYSSIIVILINVLISLFCLSCSNEILNIDNEFDFPLVSSSEEIVLGTKRENPFKKSNSRSIVSVEQETNFVYFKIRTNNLENIEKLENLLGTLNTTPLDYEVIEGGCSFPQNEGSDEYSPWFYAMTPKTIFLLAQKLGEFEAIEEMYLSDEDLECFTEGGCEISNSARFLWFNYTRVRPSGYVYFYDEVRQTYIPLKNVKVIVSQWCHVKSTYTDENGFYDIGENFTSCWQNTANIKICFETYKDSVYPSISPIKAFYNAGDKKISSLSGNDIYLAKDTIQNSFGILLNATVMYRMYSKEDGITEPNSLKFWASQALDGGVTLMRDVIAVDAAAVGAAIGTGIVPGVGTVVGTLGGASLALYLPDIIIPIKTVTGKSKTETITEMVFHEMSHASHYTSIGNGKITYWNEEYIQMLGGWLELLCNGESPINNCYNDGSSKQVCFIESWGFFYGYLLTKKYFRGYSIEFNYYFYLRNSYAFPYFYHTVFYKLYDILPISVIFEPYRYFSVNSIGDWYNKLLDLHEGIDSDNTIYNTLINSGIVL